MTPPPGMYWWRIRPLRLALADTPPSGPAQAGYLTVFLVLEIFSWGLDTEVFVFTRGGDRSYWLPVSLALIAVKLLGPFLSYWAYRPADPARFTDRFFALSCPIRLRVLILLLVALIPALFVIRTTEVFLHLSKGGLLQGNRVGCFWLAFNLCHYLWLAITLRTFGRVVHHSGGGVLGGVVVSSESPGP